ncbi:MAG: hypothetical protein JO190_08290 [Candidatus Eremiobacteraeota bacterium]|nr:hypothetical protein [Candidatus Eremiobacteraeota bacterium]MBV8499416.1 hypothetical protein [Candidatus Eremiobacteraeota bacterium]
MRVLFVTNGHGEAAIAERIAAELERIAAGARLDHLALVGDVGSQHLRDVGPRASMPSGGLIAMFNLRNIARDLRAGLLGLTLEQRRFLRRFREECDVVVAIGDVYALAMALLAGKPTVFVGSAKSVAVAPYGRVEKRFLRRADACFVRDEGTARSLRADLPGVEAANAIADLYAAPGDPAARRAVEGFTPALALFPGSRENAYDDAAFLLDVTRRLAASYPALGAALSVARGLDAERFAHGAAKAGWQVRATHDESIPFVLSLGRRELVRAWCGDLGSLLACVTLVLGQAGTANEAAAAAGVPIVAFERDRDRKASWYRRRQRGLLGDALVVLSSRGDGPVNGVRAILDDPARRARMGAAGRSRMGPAGGALRIAERIVALGATV